MILYLAAIIFSFFFAFVLATKSKKSQADIMLMAWLLLIGIHLLSFYLIYTKQVADYSLFIALGFPLPLIHGPCLFLYTQLQTSPAPFRKKHLLHFLPVLLSYLLFFPFYLLPEAERVEVFNQKGAGYELETTINLVAIYISGVIYIGLSLIKLLKYRKNLVNQFSNTDKINFNWLLYLISWMAVIWITILFIQSDQFIFGAAALFVLWLGYFSFRQIDVFRNYRHHPAPSGSDHLNKQKEIEIDFEIEEPVSEVPLKYQKSLLNDEDATAIHERLMNLMRNEKPYTNPELTLNQLAKSLDVHPNTLSQVINTKENRNFYDLINAKRVEEFIHLISQPTHQQFTLLGMAYDCGFNSKASFNRNFKKYAGITPSEFLKQQPA